MGGLRPLVAAVAAAVLTISTLTTGEPIRAAGVPLRYLGGPPGTLDPAYIGNANDVQFLLQLYAGLTRLDERGEPYPSLAQAWSVSDDGRTYTFTLRDGLRFSDGSRLTAADVRRSWLRLLDPETAALAPDVLNVVVGAIDRLAGRAAEDEVGIEAPDERTLIVQLRHPAGYFPEITATPTTFVVPRTARAGDGWQTPDEFVGSGPYLLDGTEGLDLLMRANEHYVNGPPPIEDVRWIVALDSDPASAVSAGDLDLAQISGTDATWIAYDADLGPRLHRADPLTISYLGFDTTRPPFDDPDVRRAFAIAADRERLVELSEGTLSQPAGSIVPPALWPDGFVPRPDHDPDEAGRLLDAAGYRDRSDLGTIVVNALGFDVEPLVATWREELDVEVAIETMDFGAFVDSLDERSPHAFTVSWIADYPSPDSLYSLLLLPRAASNYGRWNDERFVELLEEAAATEDEAARGVAYAAVDARVADQAPLIPWSYGDTWWLVADGLRGLGSLTIGLLDFGLVSWDA